MSIAERELDPVEEREVIDDLEAWSHTQTWRLLDTLESPITGPAGNVEYLSRWQPLITMGGEC